MLIRKQGISLATIIIVFTSFIYKGSAIFICPYGTYQLQNEDGCYGCPKCKIGYGLNDHCRRYPPYEPINEPRCMPCADGKTFANTRRSLMCMKCSAQCSGDLVEVSRCTRDADRVCGCKPGYIRNGTYGVVCDDVCCGVKNEKAGGKDGKVDPRHADETIRNSKILSTRKPNTTNVYRSKTTLKLIKKYSKMVQPLSTMGFENKSTTVPIKRQENKTDIQPTNQRNFSNHMTNYTITTNQSIFLNMTSKTNMTVVPISSETKGPKVKVKALILVPITVVLIIVFLVVFRKVFLKKPKVKKQISRNDERRSTLLTSSDERHSSLLKGRRDTLYEFFNNRHESFFCSCIPESRGAPYTEELEEVVHQLHYEADESNDEPSDVEEEYSLSEITYVIQLKSHQKDALAKLLDKKPEDDWLSMAELLADGDESLVYRVRNYRPVVSTASTPSRALFRHLLVNLPDLTVNDLAQIANKIGRTRIVDYIYQQNINNVVFSHLSFNHMNRLAQLLDQKFSGAKGDTIGDWSACAVQFGLTKDKIKSLKKESEGKHYSPALNMLSVLTEHLPELELSELRQAALCLEREDIAAYIESLMSGMAVTSETAMANEEDFLEETNLESDVFEEYQKEYGFIVILTYPYTVVSL